MRGGGTINADGFGVGWYPTVPAGQPIPLPHAAAVTAPVLRSATPPDTTGARPATAGLAATAAGGGGPLRHRRATPMWSDATLPGLAAGLPVSAALAAVRSATVGMPVVETAAAPFGDGPWLFSHNGVVTGWPGSMAKVAAALPVTDLLTLDAPTDSALLWALVRDRLRDGAAPADAVRDTVAEVERAAPGSRLNLLLIDGESLVATAVGHALSVRRHPTSVLVSSEPLDDDPAWRPVPDRTLLTATATALTLTPLGVP
jgi:glutamine amidotransferase